MTSHEQAVDTEVISDKIVIVDCRHFDYVTLSQCKTNCNSQFPKMQMTEIELKTQFVKIKGRWHLLHLLKLHIV